jgi:DUF1680 family protein
MLTRRELVKTGLASVAVSAFGRAALAEDATPLQEFDYRQVEIQGTRQLAQRANVTEILLGLDEDSLLKPYRATAGQPAPGQSLGGWYEWKPDYDPHHDDAGLAPGHSLGQWTSAMARLSLAPEGTHPELAAKAHRLHAQLASAIAPQFFANTRFCGYTLDKLTCGLMDAHRLLADPAAFATLDAVIAAAQPSLPEHAIDRDTQWKLGADNSWMWDETYTLPENLYLAGPKYRALAEKYLDDATFFEPLSRNQNVLGDHHAYSYVNALCSAMQAYLSIGSRMHLRAAVNGFSFLEQQSFATGGWGPEEMLRKPGYDDLAKSLTTSHNGFETPCGSYAHMKLTRYLLRATRDGRYGDSMERVLHNTVLGALPLQPDGRSFYSSDYNDIAKRVYSVHRWPCCSGTLPQVVADYGINTYLHAPGAVWVNLYQPSTLRWNEAGSPITLEQTTAYPEDGAIRLRFTAARPTPLTLQLRIPAWADRPALAVNGQPQPITAAQGFVAIARTWRTGDLVELNLPLNLRLETLPANGGPAHPERVALLCGPLVLFPLRQPNEIGPLAFSSDSLLSASRTSSGEWTVRTTAGTRAFVPFTEIGDRTYSTYITLT